MLGDTDDDRDALSLVPGWNNLMMREDRLQETYIFNNPDSFGSYSYSWKAKIRDGITAWALENLGGRFMIGGWHRSDPKGNEWNCLVMSCENMDDAVMVRLRWC